MSAIHHTQEDLGQYYAMAFSGAVSQKERKLMTVLSCPKCGILKQGVPEDLDEFADEILEEM